jgi:hypothetical protein
VVAVAALTQGRLELVVVVVLVVTRRHQDFH